MIGCDLGAANGVSLLRGLRSSKVAASSVGGFVGRFVRYAERMEIYGPDLGMPHTRPMGDGLFELRLKAAEGIARVFFCTVVGRKRVVLHQLVKQSEKTPNREIKIARSRMKELTDD